MTQKPTDSALILDERGIETLTRQYRLIVSEIATRAGLSGGEIHISAAALMSAFAEAAVDLRIMGMRRNPKDGISVAKIAGIVAFRLSRFSPINLTGTALETDFSGKINEVCALALAMKSIMHLDIAKVESVKVSRELQYTLVRRHMNQETLGLVFEILGSVRKNNCGS